MLLALLWPSRPIARIGCCEPVAFFRAARWRTAGRSNYASADVCTRAVPRDFRGTAGRRWSSKLLILLYFWWTHKGSNLGPLPCEGNALPLSYASGIFVHDRRPVISIRSGVNHA